MKILVEINSALFKTKIPLKWEILLIRAMKWLLLFLRLLQKTGLSAQSQVCH